MIAEDGGGGPPPGAALPPIDPHQQDQAFFESSGGDRQGASEELDLLTYLCAVLGETTPGWVHLGLGYEPYLSEHGTYRHRRWVSKAFWWSADNAPKIMALILAEAQRADVYVCPYLMQQDWMIEGTKRRTGRAKGRSAARPLVHADMDREPFDNEKADKLRTLGGFAIASGSPGHVHAYVALTESVPLVQHEALCRGLGAYLGGADPAKCSDNDVLRPPCTSSLKPTVGGGEPAPVGWLIEPPAQRADPRALAAVLGVDLDAVREGETRPKAKKTATGERAETEGFDLDMFPGVKAAVDKDSGDRSADTYGVMAACVRDHLTFAQACWALYQSPRLTERLDEREDYEIDLLRCWLRAVDDQQRKAGENSGKGDPGGFEQDVSVELRKLRVREEARHRLAIEKAGDAPPFEAMLLADTPLFSQESFRIEGLFPSAASMVINAQHKTGKTTFTLNMAHSLITGQPFLGRFCVKPVDGRVAILNYEVSGEQLGHWARQAQIPQNRLLLVNLRGRRNPFAYPDDLKRLAALLKGQQVESLIVDPFGQAYPGTNQDSSGEVSAWLTELDRYARSLVGVVDLIVTVHAGWNQERARGSSALGDWPDSILYLTRENTDDRYLRATGRDVSLDEDKLIYQPDIRRLTLSGTGGRNQVRQAKKEDKPKALILPVHLYVCAHPGASTTDIIGGLRKLKREGKLGVSFGFRDGDVRDAIELAEKAGKLRRESEGEGKPTYHFPLTTPDDDSGRGEGGDHHGTPDDPGQTPDVRSP